MHPWNREMFNHNHGFYGRNSSPKSSFFNETHFENARNVENFRINSYERYRNRNRDIMYNNYRSRSRSPLIWPERSPSPVNILDRLRSMRNNESYSKYNPRIQNSRYDEFNFNNRPQTPTIYRKNYNFPENSFRTDNTEYEYMDSVESDDGFSDFSDNLPQRNQNFTLKTLGETQGIMYGDMLHDKRRNCPQRIYKNEIKIRIFKDNIRHINQKECETFMLILQKKINRFSPRNDQIPSFFDLNWNKGQFTMKSYQNGYDWLKKIINTIKIHGLDIIPENDIKNIQITVSHTHVLGLAPTTFLERIKRQNNLDTKKWFCTFTSHSGKWTYFNFELDPVSSAQLNQNSFVYYGVEKLPVSFIDKKK